MMKIVSFLGISHKSCVNEKWNTQKHYFVHVPEEYRKFCSFSWVLRKWYVFMRSKYLDSNIFMQITVLIDFQHIKCFSVGKILAENMFTSYFLLPTLNKIGLQRFHKTSKGKTKLDYFFAIWPCFLYIITFPVRVQKIWKDRKKCDYLPHHMLLLTLLIRAMVTNDAVRWCCMSK